MGGCGIRQIYILYYIIINCYRAMHYSARRGLTNSIECRLSVCPLSVTLADQDHISWKCWKLIAQITIAQLTPLLFVAQRPSTYYQGNMEKFLGRLQRWVGKIGVLEHKSGNTCISETLKDRGKVTMEDQRSFEQYHPQYSSPRLEFVTPTKNFNLKSANER